MTLLTALFTVDILLACRAASTSRFFSVPDSDRNYAANQNSDWPHAISSLEIRQFRWLLSSNTAFFLAIQGQVLTRTYLAWDLTGSEMSLAYINMAFALPMLIFSVVGGAFSDRADRRFLAISGQAAIVLSEGAILALLLADALQFHHLLIAGAVSGAVLPFSMPARTAIVFNVVGTKRLGNATALSGGAMNLSRVMGPVIMGFTIDGYGVTGAYWVAVCMHLIALLLLFGIQSYKPQKRVERHITEDIMLGFQYVLSRRDLLACLLFGLLPMFLAMPFQSLLVVFADEVWQVGERGLGIMMAAAGLGGVLGSLWMARRGENTQRTRLMVISTLLFPLFLALFAVTPVFTWALVPLVIANIYASAGQTLNNTASQLLIEDSYRGRVSSIMLMTFGLMPLGVVPMAFLAEMFGVQFAIVAACAALVILCGLFYASSKSLRELDQHVIRELEKPAQAQ